MLHDLFSYWLTVKPNTKTPQVHTLNEILDTLNQSYLRGECYAATMAFKIDGGEISGEVDPEIGAVEEDDRLSMTVDEIAEKYPDYVFIFEENDEDDHSNAIRTEWRDGKRFSQDHARVVEPGTYDETTITAILDFLKGHNETYVAYMITRQFLENRTAPIDLTCKRLQTDLTVPTPDGRLVVKDCSEEEYPSIAVMRFDGAGKEAGAAVIDCDTEHGTFNVRVYSPDDPDGDPIVHSFPIGTDKVD